METPTLKDVAPLRRRGGGTTVRGARAASDPYQLPAVPDVNVRRLRALAAACAHCGCVCTCKQNVFVKFSQCFHGYFCAERKMVARARPHRRRRECVRAPRPPWPRAQRGHSGMCIGRSVTHATRQQLRAPPVAARRASRILPCVDPATRARRPRRCESWHSSLGGGTAVARRRAERGAVAGHTAGGVQWSIARGAARRRGKIGVASKSSAVLPSTPSPRPTRRPSTLTCMDGKWSPRRRTVG